MEQCENQTLPGNQFEIRSILTTDLDRLLTFLNALFVVLLFKVDGCSVEGGDRGLDRH